MAIDLEAFYTRYGPMVLRRCRQLLQDEQLALDVMQDVFMQVLSRRDTLTDEAPSSLLYTIATNLCLNKLRSKKRKPETGLIDSEDNDILDRICHSSAPDEQVAAASLLDKLFSRHPASSRTIAVLHLHDGLTLDEVAMATGMSVSGVRKRLRALKADIKELQETADG